MGASRRSGAQLGPTPKAHRPAITYTLRDHANRVRDMDMASLRSAFSPRKWPGYALTLLGLGQTFVHYGWDVLHIGGRLDVLWRVAESLGATTALVTSVILWPWTGIILIVSGVLYVVFVGEPTIGVQRHHWWPYVGWAIVAFVFVSMALPALYGALELYIRSEIAKGIAGAPRGESPAENNQAHPQRPLSQENRNLQPDQTRILKEELPKLRQFITYISIAYVPIDAESQGITGEYAKLFERSGIHPSSFGLEPNGPEDQGLIILVKDKTKIPVAAQKLIEILAVADIHPIVHDDIHTNNLNDDNGFIFFVAPAHVD
jgi:hypothetical protein